MTEELSPVGRFETIVLATDGSEFSAAAETTALELARRCGARLLVTRVVLTNPEYEALVPDRVQKAEIEAQKQIDKVAEEARAAGVRAETVLRQGSDPYHEVVRVANDKHADVIVIGRRTRSDLARLMVKHEVALELSSRAWWWHPSLSISEFVRLWAATLAVFGHEGVKFVAGTGACSAGEVGNNTFTRRMMRLSGVELSQVVNLRSLARRRRRA